MLQTAGKSEVMPVPTADSESLQARSKEDGRRWSNRHFVNLRLSVPFLRSRHYFAVVAGAERRQAERRGRDRRKHPVSTFGNRVLVSALGLLTMLAVVGLAAMTRIPL